MVIKVGELGTSNLHFMLRFRLSNFQPYIGGNCAPSLEYFTILQFQAKKGSIVWNRVGSSWRSLHHELLLVRLSTPEEVSVESFWWSSFLTMIGHGFSKLRATQLHHKGLRKIRDLQ